MTQTPRKEIEKTDGDMSSEILRIFQMRVKNVLGIKFADLTLPSGEPIIKVLGKNSAGKSSLLNCIPMVLGGDRWIPAKPIRDGANKGEVWIKCVDAEGNVVCTAEKILSPTGPRFSLKDAQGKPIKRPMQWLNERIGKFTFGPTIFQDMTDAERIATLFDLTGQRELLESIEKEYAELFENRTEINRDKKAAAAKFAELDKNPPSEIDYDAKLVDTAALMAERKKLENQERYNGEVRRDLAVAKQQFESDSGTVKRLESQLRSAKKRQDDSRNAYHKLNTIAKDLEDPDFTAIDGELASAALLNEAVQRVKDYENARDKAIRLSANSNELTNRLKKLAESKADILDKNLPVDGLTVDDGIVHYNGIPFDQIKDSWEGLDVSLEIGMASNAKLRTIRIAGPIGSAIDKDNFARLCEKVRPRGYVVMIEVVGDPDDGDEFGQDTIIVEAGEARQPAGKKQRNVKRTA